MKFLSVCSGIEAASVAWGPLGFKAVAFSEIEPFPCAVLKHHYPSKPNLGDMTKHAAWNHDTIDLLVGGTPCQSFSVAGLRKGLADPRGNLTLVFLGIVARTRPRWVVWENVPGVLSDSTGAFGAFLGGLAELGYGFAYRILDAQYFGVAQRRRRVFVVGYFGDWRRAAAVLFERESLRGDSAPSREAGKGIAPTISARTKGGGGLGTDFDCDGGTIPVRTYADGQFGSLTESEIGGTLNAGGGGRQRLGGTLVQAISFTVGNAARGEGPRPSVETFPTFQKHAGDQHPCVAFQPEVASTHLSTYAKTSDNCHGDALNLVAHPLRADGFDASEDGTGRGTPLVPEIARTLVKSCSSSVSNTQDGNVIADLIAVRRLTPRECERLQGFQDDYTRIPWRGRQSEDCPDGPRYKALGNSMAVPVMRWIGERIALVDEHFRAGISTGDRRRPHTVDAH